MLNAIQMCAQEAICVPRFLATFLRHPLKVGFDVRISLVCMHEGRFPAGGRFHFSFVFLDFTSTCGEQRFSHTKSEASAYEQLILASTPGKNLRKLRKDNNYLEKFDIY